MDKFGVCQGESDAPELNEKQASQPTSPCCGEDLCSQMAEKAAKCARSDAVHKDRAIHDYQVITPQDVGELPFGL